MRSEQKRRSFAAWSFAVAAAIVGVAPIALHAANKPKPEIPLGEETYEPAAPAKKAPKAQATEKASAATTSETHASDASHGAESSAQPKDPHAAPPGDHGENGHDAKPSAEEHAEGNHSPSDPKATENKSSLLKDKVPPATPAKGSGFIWFGVIFVVLAIAVFIFT